MNTRASTSSVRWLFGLLLAGGVLAVDQTTKWAALSFLPKEGIYFLPRVFGLDLFLNRGIAFGVPIPEPLLYVLIGLLVALLVVQYRTRLGNPPSILVVGCALLAGGALGNFTDRLARHSVVDFLHIGPVSVINIADVSVIAGVAVLLLAELHPGKT